MNTQQIMTLVTELNNISLKLFDAALDLIPNKSGVASKISEANGELLEVIRVLSEHIENNEIFTTIMRNKFQYNYLSSPNIQHEICEYANNFFFEIYVCPL